MKMMAEVARVALQWQEIDRKQLVDPSTHDVMMADASAGPLPSFRMFFFFLLFRFHTPLSHFFLSPLNMGSRGETTCLARVWQ